MGGATGLISLAGAGAVPVVQAGRFGAASPRRMLLLHGSGMSAGAFLQSKTASGAKEFLTGVPLRTDAGSVIPPNWLYSALDAGSDDDKGDGISCCLPLACLSVVGFLLLAGAAHTYHVWAHGAHAYAR